MNAAFLLKTYIESIVTKITPNDMHFNMNRAMSIFHTLECKTQTHFIQSETMI